MTIKIALTNLGKYNEGELVFTWLELPFAEGELEAAKEKIGINEQYEEWFISDTDSDLPGLEISEYADIEELNEIVKDYERLDEQDQDKVKAIIEADSISLQEAIEDIDSIELIEDVHNDYDLGYYWIHESGCYDLKPMGNLANYINYQSFGYDIRIEQGGSFSSFGYVARE